MQLVDGQTINIGFVNATDQYGFGISRIGSSYQFSIAYGLIGTIINFVSGTTATAIQDIFLCYDNGIFSCWNNGIEIKDLNSTQNAYGYSYAGMTWMQYVNGSQGVLCTIPSLFPFSQFGTLLGSITSPNLPSLKTNFAITTSIVMTATANFPLSVFTNNNCKINLVCLDNKNNNILTTNTPVFTWDSVAITYANGVIGLNYASNSEYPRPSDLLYISALQNGSMAGYTYYLYLSLENISANISSMTATLSTSLVIPDTVVTTQSLPGYQPQADNITISQYYTVGSAKFTIPSTNFVSMLSLAFPTACSYWKLSLTSLTFAGDQINFVINSTYTITLRLSEMDNTNQPLKSGLCNSYSITFTVPPVGISSSSFSYILQPSNQIDLWYYNKTPTKSVIISAFVSTVATVGEVDIQNLIASGLLTAYQWTDQTSTIVQLIA